MDFNQFQTHTIPLSVNQTFSMEQQLLMFSSLRDSFHLFTTTLLSLLLPLSFLLIARLSKVYYLLALNNSFTFPRSSSYLFSLFLHTNPILLHALVCLVTSATFIHGLTGSVFLFLPTKPDVSVSLYAAWIFLCTLQVCVGLGLQGSIAAGIDEMDIISDDGRMSLLSRVLFFLGLHETMRHWCKMIVKPVVDDTVLGGAREEKAVEKVALAASCGALWWWKLRDEMESMVGAAEVKKEMGLADLVAWWLYYVTLSIGVLKIAKGCRMILSRTGRDRPAPAPVPDNCNCDVVVVDKV